MIKAIYYYLRGRCTGCGEQYFLENVGYREPLKKHCLNKKCKKFDWVQFRRIIWHEQWRE